MQTCTCFSSCLTCPQVDDRCTKGAHLSNTTTAVTNHATGMSNQLNELVKWDMLYCPKVGMMFNAFLPHHPNHLFASYRKTRIRINYSSSVVKQKVQMCKGANSSSLSCQLQTDFVLFLSSQCKLQSWARKPKFDPKINCKNTFVVLVNLRGINIASTCHMVSLHLSLHAEKLKCPPAMSTWSCSRCTPDAETIQLLPSGWKFWDKSNLKELTYGLKTICYVSICHEGILLTCIYIREQNKCSFVE